MIRRSLGLLSVASLLVCAAAAWSPQPPLAYDVQNYPVVTTASTSGASITLDPTQPYAVYHTSKTTAGAEASALVAIGYGANPTAADYTTESNKLLLEAGGTVLIDRGVTTLYAKSASGSPVLQIVPRAPVR